MEMMWVPTFLAQFNLFDDEELGADNDEDSMKKAWNLTLYWTSTFAIYRLISMQIPFRKMVGSIVATGKSTVFAPKLLIWQSAKDAMNFNEVWRLFFAKKSSQVLPPWIVGPHNSNHAILDWLHAIHTFPVIKEHGRC